MNILNENDGEYALLLREMEEDAQERRKAIIHSLRHNLPHETRIDSVTLRRLLHRHNQAIAMLREYLSLHSEDSDLAKRARRLIDNPK